MAWRVVLLAIGVACSAQDPGLERAKAADPQLFEASERLLEVTYRLQRAQKHACALAEDWANERMRGREADAGPWPGLCVVLGQANEAASVVNSRARREGQAPEFVYVFGIRGDLEVTVGGFSGPAACQLYADRARSHGLAVVPCSLLQDEAPRPR